MSYEMHPTSAVVDANKTENGVGKGRESDPRTGQQDQADGRNMLNEEHALQIHIHDGVTYNNAVSIDDVDMSQLS